MARKGEGFFIFDPTTLILRNIYGHTRALEIVEKMFLWSASAQRINSKAFLAMISETEVVIEK